MRKTTQKKLRLSRETISRLDLEYVRGAEDTGIWTIFLPKTGDSCAVSRGFTNCDACDLTDYTCWGAC